MQFLTLHFELEMEAVEGSAATEFHGSDTLR